MADPQNNHDEPEWLSEIFAEASLSDLQPPDESPDFWQEPPPPDMDIAFGDLAAIIDQLESQSPAPPDLEPDAPSVEDPTKARFRQEFAESSFTLLEPVSPNVNYSFEVTPADPWTLELTADKWWIAEDGRIGHDTLTLNSYSREDDEVHRETVREESVLEREDLLRLHQTEGLEAAMQKAEQMAVSNGYLDPDRDDPRLFAAGPPDPFFTLRDVELEQSTSPTLEGILTHLDTMSDQPPPDFAPDYATMFPELAEMGLEVVSDAEYQEYQTMLEEWDQYNAEHLAFPEHYHSPEWIEDMERDALEAQWRRDNEEFRDRLATDSEYRDLIASRHEGITEDNPVRLPDPQAVQDLQHVHLAFDHENREVHLVPIDHELEMTRQSVGIIELPSEDTMLARADRHMLYDARFVGSEHIEGSQPVSTVQAIEVYRDTNGSFSGRILDVGHFDSRVQAEAQYFTMQGTLDSGELSMYSVAYAAEFVAEHNGLDAHAWRDITTQDFDLYKQHVLVDLNEADRDLPPEGWNSPLMLIASPGPDDFQQGVAELREFGIDVEGAVHQHDADENAQASAALQAAGLEPLKDFNLHACSFLDEKTGTRFIAGIFQSDPDNLVSGCQGAFVALAPSASGQGLEAEAVPFGSIGSFDSARQDWETVQNALFRQGPAAAFTVLDEFEKRLEVEPEISTSTAPSFELEL